MLTQTFEQITAQQIGAPQLRTGKLRMDSTQINSFIQDMSRLQLLVETLQLLYRLLTAVDQACYAQTFASYLRGHSGQYAYRVKGKEDTYAHLQQLGVMLNSLLTELEGVYGQEPV